MTETIRRMNPPTLPDAGTLGYSQISVVEPGRLAFVSGQVGADRDGQVPDDIGEQSRNVTQNLKLALDALDAAPDDIALMRIYVVNLTPDRQAALMPHVMDFLDGAQPSLTGIGVEALAGPGLQIEIELTVRVPD